MNMQNPNIPVEIIAPTVQLPFGQYRKCICAWLLHLVSNLSIFCQIWRQLSVGPKWGTNPFADDD